MEIVTSQGSIWQPYGNAHQNLLLATKFGKLAASSYEISLNVIYETVEWRQGNHGSERQGNHGSERQGNHGSGYTFVREPVCPINVFAKLRPAIYIKRLVEQK